MPPLKHVHKYKRTKTPRGSIIYRCVLPDCTHYLGAHHIVGKRNICWVCGNQHIIYQDSNGVLARPHCRQCTKTKKDKDEDVLTFDIPNVMP